MGYHSIIYIFLFLPVCLLAYQLAPEKWRGRVLLGFSWIFFYLLSGKLLVYLLGTTLLTHCIGIWLTLLKTEEAKAVEGMDRKQKKVIKAEYQKKGRRVLILGILILLGVLGYLKYFDFFTTNLSYLFGHPVLEGWRPEKLLMPIGISFYTFQTMSYVIDVYQKKYEAQKNIFKLALFTAFLPQLLQGPIGRYDRLAPQFFEGHDFDIKNVEFGMQRMAWGLAKKLILADRAYVAANTVFSSLNTYSGVHIVFALLLFSIYVYCDFAGGMDLVIGASEIFGIHLDENFRQPYFSKNLGEFWRRWHISLGTWMKDYIFYPFSISKHMLHFGKFAKKRFGKATGRVLPICLANILIFFIVGVWHGASWKYILYGFYNGIIIALSNLLKPVYASMAKKCHINTSSRYWKVVSIIRTFIIVNIGWLFDACLTAELAFKAFTGIFRGFTFSVLANGSLLRLGLNMRDYKILIVGTVILFITSVMKEKGINLREFVAQRPLVVRWALYIILIFATAPFGYVGSTTEFVYAQF